MKTKPLTETILISSESSLVSLYENVLSTNESSCLVQELSSNIPWKIETDDFGTQTRPTCYYGDPNCVFTYVGLRLEPNPWHDSIKALRDRVATACGMDTSILTACLVNKYPSEEGYIPWHYDEIRAHGESKIVASLSLGGPRRFCLRSRENGAMIADLELAQGSVLLMKGDVQENFEHCLPLDENKANPLRISLTFRSIVPGFEQGREIATDACCT